MRKFLNGVTFGLPRLENKTLVTPIISGNAPAIPIANMLYADTLIKGWLQTSGAGAWTIDDDVNVASITDNGAGDLTINWATAISATANNAVVAMQRAADPRWIGETDATAKSATVIRLINHNASGVAADPAIGIMVIAIGRQ